MNVLRRYFRSPEQLRLVVLVLIILAVLAFFSTQIPNLLSARTFNRISAELVVLVVVAVGQTLVLLTKNVDLSVSSMVGLSAYVVGTVLTRNTGMSPLVAVAIAVGLGVVMGSINGLIVAYGRVPAIITTLGTLAIYRTALVEVSGAKSVMTNNLPEWIISLSGNNILQLGDFNIRLLVVIALAVIIVFQLMLNYLPFGRRLYAVGSNTEAARIAGFPAQRIVFLAFLLCGALSGLGGFLYLARYANITVVAAQGMEIQVIAAAVVGGVSINGGVGTVVGATLGAILIELIKLSLIRWLAISEFWIEAILGGLILATVAIDYVVINRLRKAWARSEYHISSDSEQVSTKEDAGHA